MTALPLASNRLSGPGESVTRLVAELAEGAVLVCVLADAGWKYLSADFWTKAEGEVGPAMEDRIWW